MQFDIESMHLSKRLYVGCNMSMSLIPNRRRELGMTSRKINLKTSINRKYGIILYFCCNSNGRIDQGVVYSTCT